ncbi:MAG: potassium transporter TrkG [Bacteroidales bacterium]|nr:potassium transporter TrkG [Bacteroidales bacterium]
MSKDDLRTCKSLLDKVRNFNYEYYLDFGYISTEPHRQLLLGYLWYIFLGVGCLLLPLCTNVHVKFIDNLFTSVSAVSTTGLTTVDVSSVYTFWGQLIVLILIQLGGIGYMTMSSYVMFLLTKHFTEIKKGVLNAEFATPGGLQIHSLVKSIINFTFFFEAVGAIVLYYFFAKQGIAQPVWAAIFHSVSAFCTAGFSTFPDNLMQFSTNWGVNIVIMILSYAGAMGFIVITDIWKKITVRGYRITFTTKNICLVTILLTIWGTVHLFCIEPSLRIYDNPDRFLISLFQTVSALTTVGYNTVNLGLFVQITLLTLTVIMYFGASPSGTGGGLKSTTITATIAFVKCKLGQRRDVYISGHRLPTFRVDNALTTFVLYTTILFFGSYILTAVEPGNEYMKYLFESASALGTVGLSTGITPALTSAGKTVLIVLMYIGRVGVLTIGFSMMKRMEKRTEIKNVARKEEFSLQDDDLAV